MQTSDFWNMWPPSCVSPLAQPPIDRWFDVDDGIPWPTKSYGGHRGDRPDRSSPSSSHKHGFGNKVQSTFCMQHFIERVRVHDLMTSKATWAAAMSSMPTIVSTCRTTSSAFRALNPPMLTCHTQIIGS